VTDHHARANGAAPMDYHMHSRESCDCDATMAAMCAAALERGLREIAFTEHYDLNPGDQCPGYYQPARFFEQLEAARAEFAGQGLAIRAGVEIGEPHIYAEAHRAVLDRWPYDVVLGSLHWTGGEFSVFDRSYYASRGPAEAFGRYFAELVEMVRAGGFEILAHVDVVKRVGYDVYARFDTHEWEDLYRPVWQACIEAGIAVEINTGGYRRRVDEAHPALDALRWYREMGGELLTLGSDAHRPEHVAHRFDEALALARAAGFTRLCTFEQRQISGWVAI
jgi:histidinol-phosphatase (PHP family)